MFVLCVEDGSQHLIVGLGLFSSSGFALHVLRQGRKSARKLKTQESKVLCKGHFINKVF